jgi:Arc/MetJ-type ribon-helix-helix transcriptional regulator
MIRAMAKALELAFAKAAQLLEATQEEIGRELLEHLDALATLRAELEIGIRELDEGKGEELDIEDVITRARAEHAKR